VPSNHPTADLVARAQRGEQDAFGALVRGYLRPAYSIALGIVGRPADAEDVAQDALLLALERIDTCREPARFSGWLVKIVRHQGYNWLARRKLRDVPAHDGAREQHDDASDPETAFSRERLLRALEAISAVRREVVLLHDLEGWTHSEIAAALGISEVMSRQHLFQARRELRTQLAEPLCVGGE
jgi:RNA polymerase sigma-70 factor (ECF subfamily)